jgi:hypothetical protein
MLIIIDKNTKQVISNHGTNSLFPDGNIPGIELGENEEAIRIPDNSEQAKIIMDASEFHFDENTNVVVTKTLEQTRQEYEQTNEFKSQQILQKLNELDKIVPRIVEDIVSQGNFNLHQSKIDVIEQKQILRQQLQGLEV